MTNTTSPIVEESAAPRRRGCLFYIRRGVIGIVLLVVGLILIGLVYQTIATELDKRNYPPRGQLYTVNGHSMHLYCVGEGSPTVILQAGGFADSLWWYWVQQQVAEQTRVCAFDRPGMGWSEPVAGLRDADTINDELHTLLAEADISTPYVMVGHSYGAVFTRIYAAQYPDDIEGIILVDSAVLIPDHFSSQSEFDEWKHQWDLPVFLIDLLTRTGTTRFVAAGAFEKDGYPPEIGAELGALQSRNQVLETDNEEFVNAYWALTEAAAKAENLGELPMSILWSGETIEAYDANVEGSKTAREEIAAYSSNVKIQTIEGANHTSMLGNEGYAQRVSDAIQAVIESAKTGEPLD